MMSRSRASFTQLLDQSRKYWPETTTGSSLIAPAIYRLHEHLHRLATSLFTSFGLQNSEFEVLCALRNSPPPHQMTPTELYRKLLVSSGGMTKIMVRLEDKGWVARPPNPEDARSRGVALTKEGKILIEDVTRSLLQQEAKLLASLREPQLLEQSLLQWLEGIEQD